MRELLGCLPAHAPAPRLETGNTKMDTATYTAGLVAGWTAFMMFVPKLIAFLLIMIIGYAIAKSLGTAAHKASQKMGLGSKLERAGIPATLERAGYGVGETIGKIVYWTIMLFTLQLAFGVFGPNPISDLLTRVIAFLPNIFVAIIIMVIAASIASAVKAVVQATLGGLSYGSFLANAASISIVIVGAFAALSQLNIAPFIVIGLFYAMLAIVVGSAVIAIGGGGIAPMRDQWEKAMARMGQEVPRVHGEVQSARLRMENGGVGTNPPVGAQVYQQPTVDVGESDYRRSA
jgi:hypothetical protein